MMAGGRGYSSYRGRNPRWKILVAILLVLAILAAVIVLFLQRQIVYDENGTPHMELPWQKDESSQEPPSIEDMELIIQAPEPSKDPYIICDMPVASDPEVWSLTLRQFEEATGTACDAVVLTMKDRSSNVWYDSAAALSGTVQTVEDVHDVVVAAAVSGQRYSIARMMCFQDPQVARHFVTDRGLQNRNGYIFHDGNNSQWLNPAKPFARKYLCAMAAELAELGFDEILLADVSYPTEGKLEQIAYGTGEHWEHLVLFLQEMREMLEPYDVKLSIELPERVILEGRDDVAGLVLEKMIPWVDVVYAATTAEQAEALSTAVKKVDEKVLFIPKLETWHEEIPQCMIG